MASSSTFAWWRRAVSAAAFALVFGAASAGWAQNQGGDSASGGGDSNASASESSKSGSEQQGQQGEEGQQKPKGPDPDDPHYWAKVRKIRTVQKREFQKVNRFAISAYTGIIPNNIFERYFPFGIRANYFILENIGVELAGSYSLSSSTSLRGVLGEQAGVNASSVQLADSQIVHTNFGILWSPSYGKAAFYEEGIGYFDLFLFGGLGMVVTRTETAPNQPVSEQTVNAKAEGVLGASLAWYVNDNLAVRADYRQFLFQKVPSVGGVANPSEIAVGASWFF